MRRFGQRLAAAITGITVLGVVISTTPANAAGPPRLPIPPSTRACPTSVGDSLLRAAAGATDSAGDTATQTIPEASQRAEVNR